jgi:hypothetical protein
LSSGVCLSKSQEGACSFTTVRASPDKNRFDSNPIVVCRDYVLSEAGKKTERLQKEFVSQFIVSQESWEPTFQDKIPRGKELDWYLSGGSLQWHMLQSMVEGSPLVEDETVCSWLMHPSEQIVLSAVKSIPVHAQIEFSSELAEAGKLEQAVQLLVVG